MSTPVMAMNRQLNAEKTFGRSFRAVAADVSTLKFKGMFQEPNGFNS